MFIKKIAPLIIITIFLLTQEVSARTNKLEKIINAKKFQGTWGIWEEKTYETDKYYRGQQISIYNCKKNKCLFSYKTHAKTNQEKPLYNHCSGSGELALLSNNEGFGTNTGYGSEKWPCNTKIKLIDKNNNPIIQAEQVGEGCKAYCTAPVFAKVYPLLTHEIFARDYDPRCFVNPSKGILEWCKNKKIQELDNKLEKLWVNAGWLKGNTRYEPIEDRMNEIRNSCNGEKDIKTCLLNNFKTKISKFEKEIEHMDSLYEFNGDINESKNLIKTLEGSYLKTHKTGFVNDDNEYDVQNKMVISKKSDIQITFDTTLYFYNGHQCNISGTATYKKIYGFVYDDPDENRCYFTISLKGDEIIFTTPKGDCRKFCGARGGLLGNFFDLKDKK